MESPFEPGDKRWNDRHGCEETLQEDGEWLLDKEVLSSDLEPDEADELSELFGSPDYNEKSEFQLFDEDELND